MELSQSQLGFIRAVGYTLLTSVLVYISNATNLHGVVGDSLALIIAGLAGSFEHYLESEGKGALFGAVNK